jgi:prephenate dehydrogenase
VQVAVIGVGLIGGSIALAARERLDAIVSGYDKSEAALRAASEEAALDHACASVEHAVAGAEAVFVAVPVGALAAVLRQVLAVASEDCVVTDVGSTKRAIVAAIDDHRFVGGHPLAGSEGAGVGHARADLFEGATWYLTPTSATGGILYERLHRLLRGLGARPAAIDAETHDAILATVSHLPHVLANVLVGRATDELAAGGERLPATGPSFRDATRVAGASSEIWTDIYVSNADALVGVIERTIAALREVSAALARRDAGWITAWNDGAAADRRRLVEAQLGGGELFELRASVPNRPGVVAELALALGRAGVNIADMALYPAPDMSEGVIALWISGRPAARRAQELVSGLGFPVSRA